MLHIIYELIGNVNTFVWSKYKTNIYRIFMENYLLLFEQYKPWGANRSCPKVIAGYRLIMPLLGSMYFYFVFYRKKPHHER